jgi:apolipoprotein D and lipocalin family protein
MKRIGLGKGKGRGYRNIIKGFDSRTHANSAKGIKRPQRFRIFVKPEGETKAKPLNIFFKDKKKAETWAGIETIAGMGETYEVKGGKLNLTHYLGKWNEIARTPSWFQQGCKKAIAEYSKKKGYIEVKNSCLRDGKRDFRYAKAYPLGGNKLEVDFVGGRLFTGDYNVLYVDKGYNNAIVNSGDKYLWILSRSPRISEAKYKELTSIAKKKGFDITKLKKGGKVPFTNAGIKRDDLPIETAIYVPSTKKGQKPISKEVFRKRVDDTERFLSTLYGGFSRYSETGGYVTKKGKIIKEKGARVVAFAKKKDIKSKTKSEQLKKFITKKQKEWGQESIGYENEGDLHYISEKE